MDARDPGPLRAASETELCMKTALARSIIPRQRIKNIGTTSAASTITAPRQFDRFDGLRMASLLGRPKGSGKFLTRVGP